MAWLMVIQALMKLLRLPQATTSTQMLQMERQVNTEVKAIFTNLERKAVSMATTKVTEAYMEGVSYSRTAKAQESKLVEVMGKDLNDGHRTRLNKMISQTQDDLLKATHNTQNNVKQLVRKVVSKEMTGTGYGGKIGKQKHMAARIEKQLRKQFLEAGIKDSDVAIIDKSNRKWRLKTYSSMVTRTKMNDSYISAIREESLQDGSDLAIISTKPDTADECKNYEGMIISLNGLTAGYLTYDEIKKSKACFHPNCGHFVRPIGGIDWIPKNLLKIHEKQMSKYRGN
ncbi:phage minor capsid protein [Bacillus toyonensis]|uniref:phage minor capsid protein n=1 Tax=Bacillus toyonensis TaxID=155322 RepID=UPI003D3033F6